MKTLIVEDDRTSRIIIETVLKAHGPTTLLTSGREAAATVRAALEAGAPFDLVTMDIMMPEVDGQTALREIRNTEREFGLAIDAGTRIIMTTALGDQNNIHNAQQSRCDGYLVKPIRTAQLLGLVQKLGLIPPPPQDQN